LQTHGGHSEQALLADNIHLGLQLNDRVAVAEHVEVDREDVGFKEEVSGVGVRSHHGKGIDGVESTVDDDGGT
jgi:hypothetical protein